MGSLKSKLFTNDGSQSANENTANVTKNISKATLNNSNIKNITVSNPKTADPTIESNRYIQYRQTHRVNKTVNPNTMPKNEYFRSLRPTNKKQYSTINTKTNHNTSSSKLFNTMANVLRSKSHSEVVVKKRHNNKQPVIRPNSKAQKEQESNIDEPVDLDCKISKTEFITNQLQSASLDKKDEEENNSESKEKSFESESKKNDENNNVLSSTIDNNNDNENLETCAAKSSVSDSTSNCYCTEEDDYEWDNKNKQNDDLIASFKQQIESLNTQLEAIGKEDLKVINDLSAKIEKLAKMNHAIMSNIELEAQRKANKNIYKKHVEYQHSRLLDEYNNRIKQQNDILLSQQTQINDLRNQLYNAATTTPTQNPTYTHSYSEHFFPSNSPPHGIYAPHSNPGNYNPQSNPYYRNHYTPPTPHYHNYRPPHHYAHQPQPPPQHTYYVPVNQYEERDDATYYVYHRQNPRYQSNRRSHRNNRPKVYYDPATGCYYYHEIVPTTVNDSYHNVPNRPTLFVYTQDYTTGANKKRDVDDRPGVIITELDDNYEPIDKNKKGYVDSVSVDE